MWPRFLCLRMAAALLVANAAVSHSASLQVEPVLVDVRAPSAAATLTLRNGGPAPINAQIRVFRWSQADGIERLEPTTDVVASPPDANLTPKADYVVRIVRVSKQSVTSEEGYRLLVDELPSPVQWQGRTVNLLVRSSIPVFFGPPQAGDPSVAWAVSVQGENLIVAARNNGDRRLRISSLRVRNSNGEVVTFGNGLVGYVLGRSAMNWTASGGGRSFAGGGTVSISAESDFEPIQAVASLIRRP
jgi:fimbrial chaperone protein